MQEHPLILFCTTEASSSKHAFLLNELRHMLSNPTLKVSSEIPYPEIVTLIGASHYEIFTYIASEQTRLIGLHFDGPKDDYHKLVVASIDSNIGALPYFLSSLPNLKLVFLNYCSSPTSINPLIPSPIQTIIGTSKKHDYETIRFFAKAFYRDFVIHCATDQIAFEHACNTPVCL
ncbi:MAG: hypothetical protein U0175_04550 [Caldilineaceae bacterium]